MTQSQSHCGRTCRDRLPYEPELWCDACVEDEAADREENLRRWQQTDRRRMLRQEVILRWEERFRNIQEIVS